MEDDFGRAVAEGIASASNEGDSDDEHEVEILNHERGEVVEKIDTDGNLDAESEALRNVSQEYLEEDVPVLVPTTYENEDGETVHDEEYRSSNLLDPAIPRTETREIQDTPFPERPLLSD